MSCNMPKISKHGRFPIIVFELRAGVHTKSLSVRSFHALLEAFASLSAVRKSEFQHACAPGDEKQLWIAYLAPSPPECQVHYLSNSF